MEEGRWKREIRIETSEKEGAITETGNRRMLAGRDLYSNGAANPGRGLDDIYIRVDRNSITIIASLLFYLYYYISTWTGIPVP